MTTHRTHSLLRDDYIQALERARYYGWTCRRSPVLPGNDPLSGYKRINQPWGRSEGLVAYKALTRFWLAKARHYRLCAGRVLP